MNDERPQLSFRRARAAGSPPPTRAALARKPAGRRSAALMGLAAIGLAAALLASATVATAAPSWGINAHGAQESINAGQKPAYGLLWVTEATISSKGFTETNKALAKAKGQGVVPVVQWYYWGNSISPSCVENGCNGKSRGEWNWMAKSLARNIRATMGSSPAVVVIETEFNKNGVQSWSKFNDYLKIQISAFRTYAPNVKVVIGFGAWGSVSSFKVFAPATWKADYAGYQLLRSAYRHTDAQILAAADDLVATAKRLREAFPGKALFVSDLAISSWPDAYHAKLQGQALSRVFDKAGTLGYYGVKVIVYRWVRDFASMSTKDWHGPAEPYWGLKYADGTAKPGWWVWVKRA